jgi:hypothetical protein
VFSTLNEFQARLFAADKALDVGRGGITRLSVLTGLSRTTITKAVEELGSRGKLVRPGEDRVRRAGGGRKKVEGVDPNVRDLLKKILEETTAGDPMSLLLWTSKSTRTMAEDLTRLEYAAFETIDGAICLLTLTARWSLGWLRAALSKDAALASRHCVSAGAVRWTLRQPTFSHALTVTDI